jgi:Uncharacterized conserved protein (DUF2249)
MNRSDPWQAKVWSEEGSLHIDVRGLPPPQPLTQILQLVSASRDGAPIIVHHDRDPAMLYPELLQLGWWAERVPGDPGEFRLRLAPQA